MNAPNQDKLIKSLHKKVSFLQGFKNIHAACFPDAQGKSTSDWSILCAMVLKRCNIDIW